MTDGYYETPVMNLWRKIDKASNIDSVNNLLHIQQSVIDNARVMLFLMDETGTIIFFNREAERITGYSKKEVEGLLTPGFFLNCDCIALSTKDQLIEQGDSDGGLTFPKNIKQLVITNCFNDIESIIHDKLKNPIAVCMSINPLWDDRQEKITGFLGVAHDISQRKKAEVNLLEALKKEKQLNELKSRFVSMASHEFRTPLSTILSSAYLATRYPETSDQSKREKHLSRIVQAVNTLTTILDEFLNVGKIEEGKLTVKLKLFNLQELIQIDLNDLKTQLKPGQRFDYHHEGEQHVFLDEFMLKNIINNLVSNAIKFSPENSVICIRTAVNQEKIMISVKDQGIGISKEDQQHLMERFFRGANAVNIQGTGLGLHIVSKYVERLNGKIKFTSALEKGTTFQIIFYQKKLSNEENSVDRGQ